MLDSRSPVAQTSRGRRLDGESSMNFAGSVGTTARDQAIERRFMNGIFVDLTRTMSTVVIVALLSLGIRPRAGFMTVIDHRSRESRVRGPVRAVHSRRYNPAQGSWYFCRSRAQA